MERKVATQVKGFRTEDGAGVSLVRVLGAETAQAFDPILMLDSFDSTNPDDYTAGFPLHPHRGIETVSFVARGAMRHRDSLGHAEEVTDGEVQWMCAGSGIMHEEMIPSAERLLGVQLWLNLPAAEKMATPHYRSISLSEIEEIPFEGGTVRVLAGSFGAHAGVAGEHLPLDYYDVHLRPGARLEIPVSSDRTAMAFTLLGEATVCGEALGEKTAASLVDGDCVSLVAGDEPAEILFVSSRALGEPIAWGGPIVMNTNAEVWRAFEELDTDTFLHDGIEYEARRFA